ncbi:phage protein Gp27 family protein [Marivivens aquimaris]|uniref:phage protein Gp27 family protein n=1 Tax=Marivivens aquimaris TaxID=2774876 RepID=UPI001880EC58|nr:phage protein Gp27 family protein [Marivivens aquimaris]
MPPPRKIDLIPSELREWLQETLEARGFGDYVAVTEELNFKLEEAGVELRVGKSSVHAWGTEYQEFIKYQEQASAWAEGWMKEQGLDEEAKRHNVLFQMITTLAFKVMQAQMSRDADEIDPRELHFLGKMLKDVMSSSGMREKLMADERIRIRKEVQAEAAAEATKAAKDAGLSPAAADAIKARILGIEVPK